MPAAVFVLLHQSGSGSCFVGLRLCWGVVRFLGQSFLLPLEGAIPVLVFGLIEFFFPFTRCFFAGFAGMPLGMAPNAVAVTNIVVQFLLEFARYGFPVNGGCQIRSLKPLGEGSGEFMGGSLLGLVGFLSLRLVLLFSCACVELALVVSPFVILFVARVLGVGSGFVEQIGDGGFNTPELGWVGALFHDDAQAF